MRGISEVLNKWCTCVLLEEMADCAENLVFRTSQFQKTGVCCRFVDGMGAFYYGPNECVTGVNLIDPSV